MTEQEIFDKVVAHARTQKVQAATMSVGAQTYACKYRMDDGLRCFVGALILDKHYRPDIEGKAITSLLVCNVLKASGVLEDGYSSRTMNLLSALQLVHDRMTPDKWEEQLRRVAQEYNLTYTPPPQEEQT